MKIEIEVSEEDAALIVANTWNEKTLKEACEQLAKDEAASYARAFPGSARKLIADVRSNPKAAGQTDYQQAIASGKRPAIWPPVCMTREDLEHFRASVGIQEGDK